MSLDKCFDASTFWQYSCELYAQPGVKALCLEGQERFGLNVNLVLLCHWLYQQQCTLETEGFNNIKDAIRVTGEQVISQRRKRQGLAKATPEYKLCLARELVLEKQLQQDIIKALNEQTVTLADRHSLPHYLAAEKVTAADWMNNLLNCFSHR
ncbi:TIGR02444 family protein [Planctobacterium marinum]|uniref:TIGR02444 family protein n=1 Tax=Planctobacterium marinum TaxID=1631968 RepID=UPI001E45368E|nr:TIGR02444 family protein [Planctobacterium marinum]MCC2606478.1 TIGR02444 family protein [Planctobacterium marinum]